MTLQDFLSNAKAALRRRVLVVDDNLESVHSMALALKDMGHEVQFAINGFAAIEMARLFRPHVVLVEIRLPEFGGDAIARQLKREPGPESVRIVAITGEGGEAMRRRALQAGCEELHISPLELATLEAVVAK